MVMLVIGSVGMDPEIIELVQFSHSKKSCNGKRTLNCVISMTPLHFANIILGNI